MTHPHLNWKYDMNGKLMYVTLMVPFDALTEGSLWIDLVGESDYIDVTEGPAYVAMRLASDYRIDLITAGLLAECVEMVRALYAEHSHLLPAKEVTEEQGSGVT